MVNTDGSSHAKTPLSKDLVESGEQCLEKRVYYKIISGKALPR